MGICNLLSSIDWPQGLQLQIIAYGHQYPLALANWHLPSPS